MRHLRLLGGLAAAALGFISLAVLGSAAHADNLPQCKPGHWRMTITMPGHAGGSHVIDACITGKDSLAAPPHASGSGCGKPVVSRSGSEVHSTITCTLNGAKQIISSTFSGDFQSSYHGVIKMSGMAMASPAGQSGKMPGNAHGTSFAMTIDAKYIGPNCPQGAVPMDH